MFDRIGDWMLAVAALLTLWSGLAYLRAAWPVLREDAVHRKYAIANGAVFAMDRAVARMIRCRGKPGNRASENEKVVDTFVSMPKMSVPLRE